MWFSNAVMLDGLRSLLAAISKGVLQRSSLHRVTACELLQGFLRLAGEALNSVGVLDYDASSGAELNTLERGQTEQVTVPAP